jgi:signal transduction histidine kinase
MDLIKKALSGEKWKIVEIPILNAISGEVKTVLWNSANIMSPDGTTVLATIAQGQDITERIELEKEMVYHAQELQRYSTSLATVNKKLTLLTSITRHDINNQLTVQMGYLEILEDMPPGPDRDEYFQKVSTAAERISAMIRFTKEYEGLGVNAPSWQDTRELVDTAAKEAPLGKIVVKNGITDGTEMFADPLAVKVFYNLMDNAVRYGGKITTIRFSVEEAGDDHIIVCEDDGDGVVAAEKEKIFERGFGKNTGLGLALSREILAITDITITETGEPDKGARFEITVPKGSYQMKREDQV